MNEALCREVENLRKQTTKVLKARYEELFGEESRSSNHAHLFRRIAWRMQAVAEGDLTERARIRAAELAQDVDVRLRAPRRFWGELSSRGAEIAQRDPRLPSPGTILKREFQGQTLTVAILDAGFEFEGKTYDTLSSIAWKVTGTRWNGFAFFGLKSGARF